MAQPSTGSVNISAPLSNFSIAYAQADSNFISTAAAPIVPVEFQNGKYFKLDKQSFLMDSARRRGDAQEAAGGGYTVTTGDYSCDVFAIRKDVGHLTKSNTQSPLDWRRSATTYCTHQIMLRRERQFMTDVFTTGVFDTDQTVSNTWDDLTNSTPLSDIQTGKKEVLSKTGYEPNTLILGYDVWDRLRLHPDIIQRIVHTSGTVTPELVARLVEVDRVLISKSVYDSADEQATSSTSFTAGKNALLAHVAGSPSLETPSALYTVSWQGVSGNLGLDIGVTEIDMPHLKATRIEAEAAFDFVVPSSDLGYFFSAVVA